MENSCRQIRFWAEWGDGNGDPPQSAGDPPDPNGEEVDSDGDPPELDAANNRDPASVDGDPQRACRHNTVCWHSNSKLAWD